MTSLSMGRKTKPTNQPTNQIEDELYNISENSFKFGNVAEYTKGGNVNVIVLGHVFGRTNLSEVIKFGNMFRTHFEEKVTLLNFVHYRPCVFVKSVVSHFCGKNLTDKCIGMFF